MPGVYPPLDLCQRGLAGQAAHVEQRAFFFLVAWNTRVVALSFGCVMNREAHVSVSPHIVYEAPR